MAKKELHIQLYDQIGTDFWSGEGITAKSITSQLQANAEASEIILHINSPGGSVYEGYTIYNLLKSSGKKITAKIEGFCASIATLIALSADEIEMLPLAQWLIHNPFTMIEGDAADLEQAAAELKRIEAVLVGIYISRTGKGEDEIRALMNEDRFINAEEAVEMGFATRVLEPLKAVAFYKSNPTIKNSPDMSKTKEPSPWAKIKAAAAAFASAFDEVEEPTPQNATSETDKGTLYYSGELAENTPVFSDEAMTTPATDGEYVLSEDGRIVTVAAGIVTSIADAETEPANSKEQELNAKIAELESQLAAQNAKVSEVQNLVAAKEQVINSLNQKLSTVPGKKDTAKPAQNHAADTESTGGKVNPFDKAANNLKAKLK